MKGLLFSWLVLILGVGCMGDSSERPLDEAINEIYALQGRRDNVCLVFFYFGAGFEPDETMLLLNGIYMTPKISGQVWQPNVERTGQWQFLVPVERDYLRGAIIFPLGGGLEENSLDIDLREHSRWYIEVKIENEELIIYSTHKPEYGLI